MRNRLSRVGNKSQGTDPRSSTLALGNVVGSNIFNILVVLELSCALSSRGLPLEPNALGVDILVMIAASVACLPIFFTGRIIDRWEGGLFLLHYFAYTVHLGLRAGSHVLPPAYGTVVLGFVLPLTLVVLLISFLRGMRKLGAEEGTTEY